MSSSSDPSSAPDPPRSDSLSLRSTDSTMPAKKLSTFTDLPAEMLTEIASYLSEKDINSLSRCSSFCYGVFLSILYKTNIKSGSTALFWAAAHGMEETMKLMILFGADIHDVRNSSSTPFLLDDPTLHWKMTGTALHIAAKYGQLNIAALLVRKGADVEQLMSFKLSPLGIAIECQHPSMVKFLINSGSNVNRANTTTGLTPLFSSLAHLRSFLFEQNKTFAKQVLVVEVLLQMGADVNTGTVRLPHNIGQAIEITPLSAAFQWVFGHDRHPERVAILLRMLLEKGANIHTVMLDKSGCSLLHFTALLGFTDIVADLINRGADIEARDIDQRTPLHYAISLSMMTSSKFYLLETTGRYKGLVKRTHPDYEWHGNIETVKLLLEHGADPDATSVRGHTCHYLAEIHEDPSFRMAFMTGLGNKRMDNTTNEKTDGGVEEESLEKKGKEQDEEEPASAEGI